MTVNKKSGRTTAVMSIIVVVLSILWVLVRPDLWVWALSLAVITIVMLTLAHNAGVRQGRESAMSAIPVPEEKEKTDENSIVEAQLEAYETVLAEAELFAYELKHGLVPDGSSEKNPGYGPMDFDEWREWKEREFERTGNLWHNHPGGLPPKEDNTA